MSYFELNALNRKRYHNNEAPVRVFTLNLIFYTWDLKLSAWGPSLSIKTILALKELQCL